MMGAFTEGRFRTGYNFAIDESFFFPTGFNFAGDEVFFRGSLVWQIISFIWRISGKTAKSTNISSRENILPKAVIVICNQVLS